MFKLFMILVISVAFGHQEKIQSDADFQSELMPQELNPTFVPNKDGPWKAIMPVRYRRDLDMTPALEKPIAIDTIKLYSRIVACVVLTLSAVIEIIVYLIEMYAS